MSVWLVSAILGTLIMVLVIVWALITNRPNR